MLALLTFLIYANSLNGGFVFDDTIIVSGNESIQGLDLEHLRNIFGQHYWKAVESSGGLYRPLVMLSYAANYAAGGNDPVGYHLVNVLIHALNGILVFLVMEALFTRRALSLLASMLFILHPIRTEGVASIVGRAESLSACFVLVAWFLYLRYHRDTRVFWLWLGSGAFLLALLSKESAYAFAAMLPLTDFLLGRGGLRETFRLRPLLVRYVPFLTAIVFALALRIWILGGLAPLYLNPGSNPLAEAAAWPRFLTATHVFGRYLSLLVWPAALSADYSFNQIPVLTTLFSWKAMLPMLALAAIAGGIFWSFRRYPVLFFSGCVFFAFFVLTSNWIRPIGTIMAERLMYLPALGFNVAVAFLLTRGLGHSRWKSLSLVAAGAILIGYGLRTMNRNLDWRDHYTLFSSAAAASPGSSLVQANYAAVLLHERKDARGAILHARKALEIMPQDAATYQTLGQAYHRLGNLPEAAEALAKAADLAPRTAGGGAALREAAEVEEAMGDYARARASYEKLTEWRPADAAACLALSRVYGKLGEEELARAALERCRRLTPGNPEVKRTIQNSGAARE